MVSLGSQSASRARAARARGAGCGWIAGAQRIREFLARRRARRHAAPSARDSHSDRVARDLSCSGPEWSSASLIVGAATAWLVATLRLPGRRWLSNGRCCCRWRCRRTSSRTRTPTTLQYAGPLQTALRAAFSGQRGDYWFPEIRSLGGAAFVFTCRAVSLRLPARTHRVHGAHGGDDRCGA